jgi:hypothetical protein
MFSSDRVHPSVEGYARAAAVVLPTLVAVLTEDEQAAAAATPAADEGVRDLAEAAHEAVRSAGTEVSAAKVGREHRALLRRHPWFGEPRTWFGHKAPIPSGRSAAGAVGWTSEDHSEDH